MLEAIVGNKSAYWVMLYIYHYGEVYPRQVATARDVAVSPIIQQLKKFSNAGVLASKKVGKSTLYFFNRKASQVRPLIEIIKMEYQNIPDADKAILFSERSRARRPGKPVKLKE